MPIVLLGNHAALDNGQPIDGEQVTMHIAPESDTHSEQFRTITHDDGIWVRSSREPAVWVASDDERLARRLGAHFDCPVIPMDEARGHYDAALRQSTPAVAAGELPEPDVDTAELPSSGSGDAPREGVKAE